jgi:cyanophycinase
MAAPSERSAPPDATAPRKGHLVIIGGNEDRERDKRVLRRFVELTGRDDPLIAVILNAADDAVASWPLVDRAFADLGVSRRHCIALESREQANDPALAQGLLQAEGIFLCGSDPKRLLALLGGTRLDDALHQAFSLGGVCIAGTSAGASALSQHLMLDAPPVVPGTPPPPAASAQGLGVGLGFLHRAVIDQHFSERNRLGCLLAVVAQNPAVLGIGIDEDTALVIPPDGGIEVVGDGAVTLIDGRQMSSSFLPGRAGQALELIGVKLHLLPAGARYDGEGRPARRRRRDPLDLREMPPLLGDIVAVLTARRAEVAP